MKTWTWSDDDRHRARLRDEYQQRGLARMRCVDARDMSPWLVAEMLFGTRPVRVVEDLIRPRRDASQYVASMGPAHLHTDVLQGGQVPHVQIMYCVRDADGGDSVFADTWKVVEHLQTAAPELFRRIFEEHRMFRFATSRLAGPTLGLRHGALMFVHAPFPSEGDALGAAVDRALYDADDVIELHLEPGELFVADNLRLVHGRTAFHDRRRMLRRILVWFAEPPSQHPEFLARARDVACKAANELADQSVAIRELFGLDGVAPSLAARLSFVLETLHSSATPRSSPPRSILESWQRTALRGAIEALAREPDPSADDERTLLHQASVTLARLNR